MRLLSSRNVAFIGVFAALHAILYFISFGLWRNWAIYLEPIEGAVLGPWAGFSAALIGSIAARAVKPIDVWMFGVIAEPMGVLACGFLVKGRWKPVMAIYSLTLAAYFAHPLGRWLPLWTVLDVLLAFLLLYPAAKMGKTLFKEGGKVKRLPIPLLLISFISSATDALIRIFLLVPMGLYAFFGWPPEAVYSIFVAGAIDSYVEDALVVVISFLVGAPLLHALRRIPGLKTPLS